MKALFVLGVAVAAVVLVEEILPRIVRALRFWRFERIRAERNAPAAKAEERKRDGTSEKH